MPRRKPKIDEFLMHMRVIERQMKRHDRIGIFGLAGEGKSTLVRALREKYRDTQWNFYEMGEQPVDDNAPYVYAFIAEHQWTPDLDVIVCVQYSKDYKESVTGVVFPGDEWHPFREYGNKAHWKQMGQINITGKIVKNKNELTKILNGEEV